MPSAIESSLPSAVAIVVSTAPILALVLVMVTTRPARVSTSFLLGWCAGILVVAGVLVGLVDLSIRPRLPPTAAAVTRLGLGALLLYFAGRSWWQRRRDGPKPPKLLAKLAAWSPAKAGRVGFALGSSNPKNLALVASGATAILEASTSAREQAVAVVAFAVVASVGIALPVVLRAFGGDRVNAWLERGTRVMVAHGKLISIAVLVVLAVLLIQQGLSGLRSA